MVKKFYDRFSRLGTGVWRTDPAEGVYAQSTDRQTDRDRQTSFDGKDRAGNKETQLSLANNATRLEVS